MPRKVLLLLLMLLLFVPVFPADAENALVLDGKLIDPDNLKVLGNEVMVPLRPVLEELGYQLSFDPTAGLIVATKANDQIEVYLEQPKLMLNGQEIKISASPQLISGRTLLAAQDIGNLLGLKGFWEAGQKSYCFVSIPKLSEEDIIGQLLAADRQMLRAVYYNNQEFLTQNGVAPSPVVVTKKDLQLLLGRHWSAQMIDELWQAGSEGERYVGFYSEGPLPLSYNKEVAVTELTATGCKVRVLLPQWEDDGTGAFVERIYTLMVNEDRSLVVTDLAYKD